MSIFDNMLKSGESLFRDSVALDYDFIPKLVPFREREQEYIASCIKPLFEKRNGKNLFIYGRPGIGKTVVCKHLFKELEETTDEVVAIHINCWQKNTSHKILVEICNQLDYKFTHNKNTDELLNVVKTNLNKISVVFAFDEIDKIEDFSFLYTLLEEIYRKTIILITNHKEWILSLDQRIKSRLIPELLEFQSYNSDQTKQIMKERMKFAFVPGVWESEAFEVIGKKTAEIEDIRTGLYLMKEAGNVAEDGSSKKITKKHAEKAITKLNDFDANKSDDLNEEEKFILHIIKKNTGKKSGDIFRFYMSEGGKAVYKTFQRKVKKFEKAGLISTKTIIGGTEGTTTVIEIKQLKKLSN